MKCAPKVGQIKTIYFDIKLGIAPGSFPFKRNLILLLL